MSRGMNPAQKNYVRREVFRRSKGKCWLCGLPVTFAGMTLDHVIPKSKGGTFAVANLRAAHQPCNQRRGNQNPFDQTPTSTDERIAAQKAEEP